MRMRRAFRRKSFVVLLLTLAATSTVLLIGSAGSASATATVTYTQQQTQPIPPAANYAGSAGGDGWALALSDGRVYNVFHHAKTLTVACHRQIDASACWTTGTETVTDGQGNNFATNTQPALYLDQATGKLWVFAVRASDQTGGVVCFDTTLADTDPNPFCGFVPLTAPGETVLSGVTVGREEFGNPMRVGSRLYAFNYFPNAGVSGAKNAILCFDLTTHAACAGQPYTTSLGTGTVGGVVPEPTDAAIGTELIIPIIVGGASELACFDTTTLGNCGANWPLATPGTAATTYGAPYPMLDTAGDTTGFCLANGSDPCFTLAGASTATPSGMAGAIGTTYVSNGEAVVLGPRVYVPNRNTNSVSCWDYSQSATCPNFPKTFSGLGSNSLYTVNPDPYRPTCIWINSDNGSFQIQNFDAYTGGPCTQGRLLASQFVVSGDPQCFPTSYTSFRIISPLPSVYGGGSVSFADGDGSPIPGLPSVPLDSNGTADLTGLSLNTPTGLPQFLITFNNGNFPPQPLQVQLTWVGPYNATCLPPGGTAQAPDALDAVLSDGTNTSHNLTEWVGTPVTNNTNGLLTGTNTGSATGTVTYHWWTDSTCSTKAVADDTETIATPGTLPASQPVNLPAGTYYETVDYSGDALNQAASTSCGSETLTVNQTPTHITYTGDTSVYAGAQATISFVLTDDSNNVLPNETVTITLPDGSPFTGTTDANGVLSTTITAPLTPGSYPVSESFGGQGRYLASTGPGTLQVKPIPTDITYTGDTAVYIGQPATISFVLDNSLTHTPLANEPVTITLPDGTPFSGKTDSNGVLSDTITAPLTQGSYPVSESFGGDSPYLSSNGPGTLVVSAVPTTITYTGDTSVYAGQPATISFVLRDSNTNAVLPGEAVTITLPDGTPFTGTTDPNGVLSTTITAPTTPASYPVSESFGGKNQYLGSTGPGTLQVKPIPTNVTYTGDTSVTGGTSANVTFVLRDSITNSVLANMPVTITLPGGGTVSGITDTSGVFSTTTGPLSAGTYSVSEAFAGKNQYLASTGPGTITVTGAIPPPLNCTAKSAKCESILADPTVVSNTQLSIVATDDAPFTGACAPTALLLGNGQQLAVSTSPTSGQPVNYVNSYNGSLSSRYQVLIKINLPAGLTAGQYSIRITACDGDGDQDQWTWTVAVDGSGNVTSVSTGPGAIDCTAKATKCESVLADPTVASSSKLTIVAMDDSPIGTSGATAPSAVLTSGQVLNVTTAPTSGQPSNYVDSYKGSVSSKYQTLITINLPTLAAGNYTIRVTAYDGDGDVDQWNWPISVDGSGNVTTSASGGGSGGTLAGGTTACNGVYNGSGTAVTVAAGATCTLLPGTTVSGNVTVAKGGTLVASGVTIGGDLSLGGSATVCGSTITHDLSSSGASGPVMIGGASCAGNTVGHDLNVTGDTGGVSVVANTAGHDLNVKSDGPTTVVSGNTAGHDANCGGNTGQSGSGNSSSNKNSCPI